MSKRAMACGVFLFLALAAAAGASNQYKVVGETRDFYFGHISYIDKTDGAAGPVVLREDKQTSEPAALNMPLGPGDIIQTSDASRCEIQFDNGTIVRLDVDTKLKIESILAKSLSTSAEISNLLLAAGQVYVMHRRYNSVETFQIITPRAAVKLDNNAVALVEMLDGQAAVQVERGKAGLLFGQDKDNVGQKSVAAGQRLVVADDNILKPVAQAAPSEFKAWNERINADFKRLHEGNILPKPYQNLPPAVFDFAQKFGNPNGEWVWHDLYGYVWRPYLNDYRYPWGIWQVDWQPYYYGNWEEYKGKLYWIPAEYWGWVPYHLGLWMWDKKAGWVWLPGSLFASAWATWDFFSDNYVWRPFSLFDFGGWWMGPYWESPGTYWEWGLGPVYAGWQGGSAPGTGRPVNAEPPFSSGAPPVKNVVDKNSLQKPPHPNPTMPVPRELKGSLQALQAALKRNDESALASLRETIRQSVAISRADLGKAGWQDRTVPLDRVLERARAEASGGAAVEKSSPAAAAREALRQVMVARALSDLTPRSVPAPKSEALNVTRRDFVFDGAGGRAPRPETATQKPAGGAGQPGATGGGAGHNIAAGAHGGVIIGQPGVRFRDWNPDVGVAIRLGVRIVYSSRTNEVLCPQLGLSSGNRAGFSRLSPGSYEGFFIHGGSGGGNYGNSGSVSSPSISNYSGSSSGSSAPRGSSKDGSGGKQ